MKKRLLIVFLVLLFGASLSMVSSFATADASVTLDGKSYTSLVDAANALPSSGGTIVVTTDVQLSKTEKTTLPKKDITITSTNNSVVGLGAGLELQDALTIKNIKLDQTVDGANIYANGNKLVIDTGVIVENSAGGVRPNVFGGATNTFSTTKTSVTIKSGTWAGAYGGNEDGKFTGDTEVIMTGGDVTGTLSGGSKGIDTANDIDFTGNTLVDVSGGTISMLSGGNYGLSGMQRADVKGDISVKIHGDVRITNNVYGVGYYNKVITKGDVSIDVYGNAVLERNLYAAGYGKITPSTGETLVTIRENAKLTSAGGIATAGSVGTHGIAGNTHFIVKDNASITTNIRGTGAGPVTGNTLVEIFGGTVSGVSADANGNATIGGTKTVNVDLTKGKDLVVNGLLEATNFVGGKVTLDASASIVTDKLTGKITASIDGESVVRAVYVSVKDKSTSGQVEFVTTGTDKLEKTVTPTSIDYVLLDPNRFESVKIRFNYYNSLGLTEEQPSSIKIYKGIHTPTEYRTQLTDVETGVENGKNFAKVTVEPGLYHAIMSYSSGGTVYKYFYVSGKLESQTYDIAFAPYKENNYSEKTAIWQTDEILEQVDTDDLVGFPEGGFDTPTFTKHADHHAEFLTNEDVCEYADNLAKTSNRTYVYYPFGESELGHRWPIIVISKHDLSGMSWEEAGAFIRAKKGEVFMTAGGVHGNEPAGVEGNLAFAKDLTGSYGDAVVNFFEAIIVMPAISVDNLERYVRSDPETGRNPNRDLMQVKLEGTEAQIRAFNNFLPTVHVDCHEDYGRFLYNPDNNYLADDKDVIDVAIRNTSNQNSPMLSVRKGQFNQKEQRSFKMMMDSLEAVKGKGLRPSIYYVDGTGTMNGKGRFTPLGSLDFIVEVLRMTTGKTRYARAVYAMNEALKSLLEQQMSYGGEIAREAWAARDSFATITKFDENRLFALETKYDNGTVQRYERPVFNANGKITYKTVSYTFLDNITKVRALPTAYVIDGRNENMDAILRLLDIHNIPFTRLEAGTTLTLRRYQAGADNIKIYENTVLGEAKEVTFPNGAIAVTLNNMYAYLAVYLFEPDSAPHATTSDDSIVSFAHMDLIDNSDNNAVYRSEVDDICYVINGENGGNGSTGGDTNTDNKGCGSALGGTSTILLPLLLAGAVVLFKKKD